jgi:hypothetical protein
MGKTGQIVALKLQQRPGWAVGWILSSIRMPSEQQWPRHGHAGRNGDQICGQHHLDQPRRYRLTSVTGEEDIPYIAGGAEDQHTLGEGEAAARG